MNYLFVVAATVLRVIPHPWNVSPLAAMFLFSGSSFRNRRTSLLAPLAALLISDFIATQVLHAGFGWFSPTKTIAFLLIGAIGWKLRDRITAGRVAGASLAGSVVFFVVSNLGVWLGGVLYPRTLEGLAACYVAAIPFFGGTLVGDLFYAAVLFGSWQWMASRKRLPARA